MASLWLRKMVKVIRVKYRQKSVEQEGKNIYQVDYDGEVWDSLIGKEIWSRIVRASDEIEAYKLGMEWLSGKK